MTFPRTDCAICFEGDTTFAYPMMIQLQTAVANYPRAINRSQDLFDFKGHILRVLNDMMKYKSDYEPPDTSFLFGGYSWDRQKFALWKLHYNKHYKIFTHRPISFWRGIGGEIKVAFSGDYVEDAKARLVDLLRERGKLKEGNLDMEPFEVLRDMLREDENKKEIDAKYNLIGGAPQLIKIYEHMNRAPIAVNWKINDENVVTVLGRPLMNYEISSFPILDPDSLTIKRSAIIGEI